MPLRFSLREHKNYAAWSPDLIFSKPGASTLRMTTGTFALGDGYFFIVANRVWLNGKYIRFQWDSNIPSTLTAYALIYDGEYVRSSDVDFPSGSGIPAKGNGLLQTLASRSAPFSETLDIQANVGGGSETLCTIFFKLHDNQSGASAFLDLDWVEFNSGAGGSGTLADEQFTDGITMEKTGTLGDYGYISTGILPTENAGSADLLASFEVGQDSQDLPASFHVGQDAKDLFVSITIRHSNNEEILGKFTPIRSTSREIFCETIILNVGSEDVFARFKVAQSSAELYGHAEIRRETSIDLPSKLTITHWIDFLAKFTVRQSFPLPLAGYRKKLTITGSIDGALTNYPIGIKVYYGAGVDGTEAAKGTTFGKVYCNSKCRTDFADLRFLAFNGITELDYWMEEKTDGVSAIFWIKIPQILQSPLTIDIYINYGDAKQITSTSDGDATFEIFDDFDGAAVDPTKWDETLNGNTRTVEDGKLKVNITAAASYALDSKIAYDFPDNVEIMAYIDVNGMEGNSGILTVAGRAIDRNAILASWGGGWYKEGNYDRRIYGVAASWWSGANRGCALGESRHGIATLGDDYITWFCEGVKNFNDSKLVNNNFPMGADRYIRYQLNSRNAINIDLFWIAVRKITSNEPTATSWGAEEEIISGDLLASFEVGQDSQDLPASFHVGQDAKDLFVSITIRHTYSIDLFAKATIRHTGVPVELLAKFDVMHWRDLLCHVCIPHRYNFSDGMGVAFKWWGSGGMDQNIDFEMWSPTGGWVGKFPDGPAKWRQVILSWDDLTEVDLDGSRPNKSNITGMYWTYHTPGVRRVDAIQTWMIQDLLCKFIVRGRSSPGALVEIPAKFEVGLHRASEELKCVFEVNHFEFFGPWLVVASNPENVAFPHQEAVFRWGGQDRYWIFYIEPDGADVYLKYITSTDGENWGAEQNILVATVQAIWSEGYMFSAWVDKDAGVVHLAICTSAGFAGNDLEYKRGTMSDSGAINWDPTVTVTPMSATTHCYAPTICCDVNGYPYITWYEQSSREGQGKLQNAYIAKSDTKDGTFTLNTNYEDEPYGGRSIGRMSTNTQIRYIVKPVPLANGRVFAFYGGDSKQQPWWPGIQYPSDDEFHGRSCDGGGMGAQASQAIGSPWEVFYGGAAIAVGNDVLAAVTCEDLTLRVCKWSDGSWGTPQILQTGVPVNTIPRFFKIPGGVVTDDKVVIVWIDEANNEVRYKVSSDDGDRWNPPENDSYCVLMQYPAGFGGGGDWQPLGVYGKFGVYTIHSWSMRDEADHAFDVIGFAFNNTSDELMFGYIRKIQALGTP